MLLGAGKALGQESNPLHGRIPPQALATALITWAQQTGVQVVYASELVGDRRSLGAAAGLSPTDALTQLLHGTGLHFEFLTPRLVRIVKWSSAKAVPSVAEVPGNEPDVIVSGNLLQEPGRHTPVSLIVWTSDDLQAAGVKDAEQLASITPGVEFDSYQDYGAGIETNIAIRGINARDGSTVAVYLGDTPIPTDRASTFGRMFPALFGLDRVEVLRGAQGTLMGEGAEGGAVRFVPAQPSLTTFDGSAHAEYATTLRGAASYEGGGELGGPLVRDILGFRLSAWSRHDGGYVNRVDPFTGVVVDPDANWMQHDAFRGAFTLAAGSAVTITPAMDYQSATVHDTSAFYTYLSSPGDGILQNGKLLRQPYADRFQLPSLRIAGDLSFAELVSETAYLQRSATALYDATNNAAFHYPNPLGPEYPVSYAEARGAPLSLKESVLSQQLRIASSTEGAARLNWVVGASYLHSHYYEVQDLVTEAFADGGNISGRIFANHGTLQLAGFAQADLLLRERLWATVGLRVEHASYDSAEVVFCCGSQPSNLRGAAFSAAPQFDASGSATLTAPRLALTFRPDDRSLYYLSAAEGYRMGGENVVDGAQCGVQIPAAYGPDSVWNFEAGAKSSLLSGRLLVDGSLFHALWRNMQTQIPFPDCAFGYTANAGRAASDGFDFGAEAALTENLRLRLTLAYADARYTQTVYFQGRVVATDGDAIGALPLVAAPFSAFAAVNYQRPLASGLIVRLWVQDAFHSRNHGPFTTDNPSALIYAPERTPDPPTNLVDLRIGTTWRALDLSAFVANVFDAQPTLQRRNRAGGADTLFYATTFRPRTVGLTVSWQLGPAAAR